MQITNSQPGFKLRHYRFRRSLDMRGCMKKTGCSYG
jgi:hypothetical protein